jgi:uncharacterized protein
MSEQEQVFSRRQMLGITIGLSGFAMSGATGSALATQGSQAEQPNAARVRRLYEILASRDAEQLSSFLAPDVVFHIPGSSIVAGEHKGREAIMRLFRTVVEQTRGTFKTALSDVIANDQYAVTKHRWSAERKGRRIEMDNINVYRFDKSGKLIERWEFVEDQQSHDDFWS